jgi:hypothetical protein
MTEQEREEFIEQMAKAAWPSDAAVIWEVCPIREGGKDAADLWCHVKTGGVYEIVGECIIEATNKPAVLYRSVIPAPGRSIWARPKDEFFDGRFEKVDLRETSQACDALGEAGGREIMSDIVERLKSPEVFLDHGGMVSLVAYEAADALEAQAKEIQELKALLKDCADDLEAEVEARYGENAKKCMPHRYERDMAPVVAARAALNGEKG